MKNGKNYMSFLIIKIWQILKGFGGTKTLAKTSYFWGVISTEHLLFSFQRLESTGFETFFLPAVQPGPKEPAE